MSFVRLLFQICIHVLIGVVNVKTEQEPSMDEMAIDDSLSLMARLKKYVASDLFLHRYARPTWQVLPILVAVAPNLVYGVCSS